ncbi:MAG TPA: hypothetical protein PK765_00175 [bacterium]|nr:hypothetical protein [bacterium]
MEGRITLNNPPQDLRVIYDGIASLRQIASQPDTDPKTKKLAMEGVECGDSVYYMLYHKYITR